MATKVFVVLLLLFTIACGTPAKQNSTSSGGGGPRSGGTFSAQLQP